MHMITESGMSFRKIKKLLQDNQSKWVYVDHVYDESVTNGKLPEDTTITGEPTTSV